jgi:hypothetical protein
MHRALGEVTLYKTLYPPGSATLRLLPYRFHFANGFATQRLALYVDSLVRVSRRVI